MVFFSDVRVCGFYGSGLYVFFLKTNWHFVHGRCEPPLVGKRAAGLKIIFKLLSHICSV
jgi:hypothetical protein